MFETRIAEGKPSISTSSSIRSCRATTPWRFDTDIEIGGNDQTFNMLAGRTLLKALKNKEKFVLTNALLVDATGKKMERPKATCSPSSIRRKTCTAR